MISVAELLPQKYPFVMVDTLIHYTETSIRSGYTIQPADIFAQNGVFLEGGIIEHMAQSVALHTGYQYFLKNEPAPVGYIGSISNVSVHHLPAVGETLTTRVEILQEFMGITLVAVETFVNDLPVASGKMKTVLAS
ncbi:MAG: hypothetical protein KF870_02475 [Leadbetterella sp.]|nr:hypothetical protein [Leadbetterella sp.]